MKTMRSPMLTDDDIVAVSWRQHPIVLALPATPVIAMAVAASLGVGGALSWWLALGFALRFVWIAVGWWRDVVVVTHRQILRDLGVLVQQHEALPLTHVAELRSHRSLMGQILGYGEIAVESTRQSAAPTVFSYVPNPERRYLVLKELLAGRVHPLV